MIQFWGIIIEVGLLQMTKVDYYWNKSRLYRSEVIQNTMSRGKFELLLFGSGQTVLRDLLLKPNVIHEFWSGPKILLKLWSGAKNWAEISTSQQ
jgi:hypothetical protein